ncbi:MAG: type IV pilus assembly protein PilM [Acidobacteria bacterium]|nr:type IV pilus assembly protein PilM [Acidobacteriota bacterium]
MALSILNRNKQAVGLDIGSSCIKAIELRPLRKGGYELVNAGLESLSPDCIVDGVIISKNPVSDAIQLIFDQHRIKNRRVATSVSGHSVIVKKIGLPMQTEEDLAESIRWEAEQYIPFDIADVHLDYQVLGANAATGNTDVLLVAVKKEKISEHTSVISMAGRVPAIVDVDAFALQNAYQVNYEPVTRSTAALLDIGATTMTINIAHGSEFLFTRDVGVGGKHYTDFIQKEFNLDFAQAQNLKHGLQVDGLEPSEATHVIESVSEIICLEIQKTFDFFKSTTTVDRIDRMLVSGGAAHTPGLIEALSRKFGVPTEKFDAFKNISYDPKQIPSSLAKDHAPDFAVAVGLALRTFEE